MKPCDDRWREELVDHAVGSPASSALAEHLRSCAVCSEALREWKARMDQIAAGIRQMAASEPSAGAALRVMAEVRSRRPRVWLPKWRWATATLSGLAIISASFIYAWRAREQRNQAERTLAAAAAIGRWKSPTEGLLRSPADRWLKATPRLGQYFYQLKTNVPEKESENP